MNDSTPLDLTSDPLLIDWNKILRQTTTTPTLQVVVNPLLRRGSPIHDRAFDELRKLGADYARFVPGFPHPQRPRSPSCMPPPITKPAGISPASTPSPSISSKPPRATRSCSTSAPSRPGCSKPTIPSPTRKTPISRFGTTRSAPNRATHP